MKVTIARKKVKNLTIKIIDFENILVTAPNGFPVEQIKRIVDDKKVWIEKKLAEKVKIKEDNAQLYKFECVLLNGEQYKIRLGNVPNVCFVNEVLILPQKKCNTPEDRNKEISKFILSQAKISLPKVVAYWGTKMSLCPTAIKVRKMRSRWGSCNGDGEITLNSRLFQLPGDMVDYVVVHELCHLKNMNHSQAFWSSVEEVLPNFLETRKLLKHYDFLTTL